LEAEGSHIPVSEILRPPRIWDEPTFHKNGLRIP